MRGDGSTVDRRADRGGRLRAARGWCASRQRDDEGERREPAAVRPRSRPPLPSIGLPSRRVELDGVHDWCYRLHRAARSFPSSASDRDPPVSEPTTPGSRPGTAASASLASNPCDVRHSDGRAAVETERGASRSSLPVPAPRPSAGPGSPRWSPPPERGLETGVGPDDPRQCLGIGGSRGFRSPARTEGVRQHQERVAAHSSSGSRPS